MRITQPRGFTLVEIVVVVGIIGILTTVAAPSLQRMNMRSKTAERPIVMRAILRGIEDVYRRNGVAALDGTATNPGFSGASPGMDKKLFDFSRSPDWSQVTNSVQIDRAVYYSYSFQAWEPGPGVEAGAWIRAVGDLDGDGAPSVTTLNCIRTDGVYQCLQDPAVGLEDATTY